MLRIEIPDRPGQLGAVATAIGAVGVSISAVEIVERYDGKALNDFMLEMPSTMLPDTVVSACMTVPDAHVVWISRYPESWGLESDIEVLDRMLSNPATAGDTLTQAAPVVFHCHWALLLDGDSGTAASWTALAPELAAEHIEMLGDLRAVHRVELPDNWIPNWGSTVCALAPVSKNRTIIIGRQGGPEWLDSELARLSLLSAMIA